MYYHRLTTMVLHIGITIFEYITLEALSTACNCVYVYTEYPLHWNILS